MLSFLPPDVPIAVLKSGRPTHPDGRLIPQTGDEVYQTVQGAFGMPASLSGIVRGSKVEVTGGHSLLGALPIGKRFKLTPAWTVRNDPEILRRRAEEEAQRAAEAQAKRDRAAREEAAKETAQAVRGMLTAAQIRVGDILEDDAGIRWWVGELDDRGEPYGIEEDDWGRSDKGPGYLGRDLRGWRILERGVADPRPEPEPEPTEDADDTSDARFQPGDLIETDDAYPHYGTVTAVHTAAALGYDPDTEGRFLYQVHWTRNSRGESIECLNKPDSYTKQVFLRPSRRPDYSQVGERKAVLPPSAPMPITDSDILRGAQYATKEAGLWVNYEIKGQDFRWYPFQVGGQTFEAVYHPKHLTWIRGPVRSVTDTATYTWFPRTKQLRARELPERIQELLSGRVQLGGFRKKRNPAAPTVQQVAKAIYQLERAVDEPERLTPAVLRVLRAAGWREGDPVHDPRVDHRRFDAQMVVSDLSGPGFDLAGEMWA